MVVSVNANPPNPLPGHITTITADFTQNSSGQTIPCNLPGGIPVAFSATEGAITPPLAVTMIGTATSSLTTNNLASLVCATVEPTAENFLVCQAINPGFYRLNWGCVCTDTGDDHVIIGSFNQLQGNALMNQINGWAFDSTTSMVTLIGTLSFGTATILNNAVYNHNDIVNIAVLTQTTSNDYLLSLATCPIRALALSLSYKLL